MWRELSEEKGLHKEFELYNLVERLAPKIIAGERKMYKGVSVNVDFYSGFVYKMLGLPMELYTPIFAIARMSGWAAHRLEELANNGKIIRPAYKSICEERAYVDLKDRRIEQEFPRKLTGAPSPAAVRETPHTSGSRIPCSSRGRRQSHIPDARAHGHRSRW